MDIKRARIFVIEDEKIMSTFILGNLRRMGILDLFAFDNGLAALREVNSQRPDLILTDVHMQPMGGIEFLRHLRGLGDARLAKIPVIFLSADSSAATIGEALPLGVAGYIVKPPSINALAAKIEQALKALGRRVRSWPHGIIGFMVAQQQPHKTQ
jgi:two-component system, chemotaxis family, chemotaxis protein CheY